MALGQVQSSKGQRLNLWGVAVGCGAEGDNSTCSTCDSHLQHPKNFTRQMMIIAGGKPKPCCYMARHGMLSERVGSMHACMCISLVQNAV